MVSWRDEVEVEYHLVLGFAGRWEEMYSSGSGLAVLVVKRGV